MNMHRSFALAICCALCLVAPDSLFAQSTPSSTEDDTAQGQERSLEAELEALEAEVYDTPAPADSALALPSGAPTAASVGAAALQSMNPDISLILSLAGAWFSDEPDMRGGHDPSNFGFNLQGLELAVGSDVGPYFRFDSALVFYQGGVEMEEAYASTLALPAQFQARAGQFKTRFGRLNSTHLHQWNFVTQSLLNAKFLGGEGLRGLGAEVSRLALWVPGTFRWYLAAQNISSGATGRSFAPSSSDIETFSDLTVTARAEEFVELSSNWDLLFGLSYANGVNKTGRDNRTEIYGADTYLKWRPRTEGGRSQVGWQTEFMLRRRQVPGTVLQDFGVSSWVQWTINKRWATAIRGEYISAVDSDPLDPEWNEDRQRAEAQVSFAPSHFSRLRLQYGLDHMPYRAGTSDDEWVQMVLLQAEFSVGAHGAHSY